MVQIAVVLQRRGFDVVAIIGGEDGGTTASRPEAPALEAPRREAAAWYSRSSAARIAAVRVRAQGRAPW